MNTHPDVFIYLGMVRVQHNTLAGINPFTTRRNLNLAPHLYSKDGVLFHKLGSVNFNQNRGVLSEGYCYQSLILTGTENKFVVHNSHIDGCIFTQIVPLSLIEPSSVKYVGKLFKLVVANNAVLTKPIELTLSSGIYYVIGAECSVEGAVVTEVDFADERLLELPEEDAHIRVGHKEVDFAGIKVYSYGSL